MGIHNQRLRVFINMVDTTTQTLITPNVFQMVTYDTEIVRVGWLANFTGFHFGMYLVYYTMFCHKSADASVFEGRCFDNKKNQEIKGSQSSETLRGLESEGILSNVFLFSSLFTTPDIQFEFTNSAPGEIQPFGLNATTPISASVSIFKIN